jgi:hypothetical protein
VVGLDLTSSVGGAEWARNLLETFVSRFAKLGRHGTQLQDNNQRGYGLNTNGLIKKNVDMQLCSSFPNLYAVGLNPPTTHGYYI